MKRLVVFALALVACARPQPRADGVAPPPSQTASSATASSAPVAPPPPASTGGALVTITNVLPGAFEITSDSDAPQRLAFAASLERRAADGTWVDQKGFDLGQGYRLTEDCSAAAPACVELAPHATVRPAPFRGYSCSAQCNGSCRANVWVGPATFRLTVRVCDGGAAFSGPAFELPDYRPERAFERWGLASEVVKATIMRLDGPPPHWRGDEPASQGKLAGFDVRPATRRAMDPSQLKALVDLVQAPSGFDDDILKRCAMKDLVGFELVRSPATTGKPREDVVEIAIDLACNKLFAVRGGANGSKRTLHATHYDPSRAGFIALIKATGL